MNNQIDERLKQYMYRDLSGSNWFPLENTRIMFYGREVSRIEFPYKDVMMVTANDCSTSYPVHCQAQLVVWKLELALTLSDPIVV